MAMYGEINKNNEIFVIDKRVLTTGETEETLLITGSLSDACDYMEEWNIKEGFNNRDCYNNLDFSTLDFEKHKYIADLYKYSNWDEFVEMGGEIVNKK
ncbi:MAG TPA: hypothetical protein GX695_05115 [Acholeplasmataceae bacterium]|nr:hypothetical protein [Acholeplasmataceae bacterium]